MDAGAERAIVHGATRDLERVVTTHLFVICPNHSGSTFLRKALAASQAVWSLPGEADRAPGFVQPARPGVPERVAHEIRTLVPELDDLDLRRCLPVKGYDEMLTDMNARQIARLTARQVAAFNRVFHEHRDLFDLFDHFGYEMLDAVTFLPVEERLR